MDFVVPLVVVGAIALVLLVLFMGWCAFAGPTSRR